MKKIAFALVIVLALSGIVVVLQQNKARSEAKVGRIVERPFTVSVATVATVDIGDSLVMIGTIAPDREVAIASETTGKIRSIAAEIGSFKAKGTVIATVDAELKQAALTIAEANLEKARKDLQRIEQVQAENALPDQTLDDARLAVKLAEAHAITTRRQLRDTRIVAPFSGVIAARSAEIGTMVQPGMVIASLVDVSTLKVRLNVPEADVVSMKPGDRVEVTCDIYPGAIFAGNISAVGAKGDAAHTYPVDVTIANQSQHPLKAGMFARVRLRSASTRPALTIPRAAIAGSVKDPKVFVLNPSTKIVKVRSIRLGERTSNVVEVLGGIKEGEVVVVTGHTNLRDGARVAIGR